MPPRPTRAPAPAQSGLTYIGLMLGIVIFGALLAAVGPVWHTVRQREKERELLYVGDEFRRAIEHFHEKNANAGDGFPKGFDELLLDPHQPTVHRYLRRVYPDPLTGSTQWGIVKSRAGNIAGVYSLAQGVPLKQFGFSERYQQFANSKSYADWQFSGATAVDVAPAQPVAASPGAPPPVEPAPAPVPVPEPPQKPPVEREAGKPPSCEWIGMNDENLCRQEKNKWHDSASNCYAMAQVRLGDCMGGTPVSSLPPLPLRYGSPR